MAKYKSKRKSKKTSVSMPMNKSIMKKHMAQMKNHKMTKGM